MFFGPATIRKCFLETSYCKWGTDVTRKQSTSNFLENERFLRSNTHRCVCGSRGKECSSSGKFSVLRFLVTSVLRLALLPYYRPINQMSLTEDGHSIPKKISPIFYFYYYKTIPISVNGPLRNLTSKSLASPPMERFFYSHEVYFQTLDFTKNSLVTALFSNLKPLTAWKVSVFWVILVLFLLHSDQNNSEYGHFLHSGYVTNIYNHFFFKKIILSPELKIKGLLLLFCAFYPVITS